MNNLLVRELTEIIEGQKSKVLSVFLVGTSTNRDEFDGEISKALSESNLFDRLHVIGTLSQVEAVSAWLGKEEDSGRRLRTVFKNFETEVCFIVFDEKAGEYRALNARLDQPLANSHQIISSEKRASLFHAFETSSGMMIAPDGFHYAKTSGAHSTSFIRASNVLERSENVSLMAFWMLSEIWKQDVDQVVVDTSGIYAPALLATQMRALMRPGGRSLPVWSHQSFRGLENIGHISSTTLCFISASTSGTLANRLVEKGALKEKVWTLFGLSHTGWSKDNTYCDLLEDPIHFEGGYKAIENQKEATCRYCKSGSHSVALSGDQFVLEPPTLLEIDLLTTDIPDQMRINLSEMMGMGLFKVHRVRKGRKTGRHEIYLDVDALFRNLSAEVDGQTSKTDSISEFWQKFLKAWKTLQSRAATFNVERLVFLAHSGSEQLVKMVNNQFPVSANVRPKLIAHGELSKQPVGTEASGTVVVSSFFEDRKQPANTR